MRIRTMCERISGEGASHHSNMSNFNKLYILTVMLYSGKYDIMTL